MGYAVSRGNAARFGAYVPRATEVVAAVPDYERRLTLMLFVVAPIIGLLIRFGLGAQHLELAVVKAFDDAVIALFALIAVPRLPALLGSLPGNWIALMAALGFLLVLAIKAVGVDWSRVEFFWSTFGMELKPVYYVIAAVAIYLRMERMHLEHWLKRFQFFAGMMILSYFIQLALGMGSLARASAVEEANYDGFIIGMGLLICYHLRAKVRWHVWALLLVATVLTLSRTGLAALLVLGFIVLVRHRQFGWLVAGALALIPAAYIIYITRANGASSNQFDRFRMWQSFFMTVRHWGLFEWLFGIMPGVPIRYYDPFIQWFIDNQSVAQHDVAGLHPFNYHGMHIRFILTWGLVGVFVVLGAMAAAMRRGGWLVGLMLLYVLIQGFSMGVVYLTTVAVPALMMTFEFWRLGGSRRDAEPLAGTQEHA